MKESNFRIKSQYIFCIGTVEHARAFEDIWTVICTLQKEFCQHEVELRLGLSAELNEARFYSYLKSGKPVYKIMINSY